MPTNDEVCEWCGEVLDSDGFCPICDVDEDDIEDLVDGRGVEDIPDLDDEDIE